MLRSKEKFPWLYDILLLVVLAAAAWLRFTGSDWGELQHQHPDELTVTSTTYDIAPIGTLSDSLGPAPTVENQPWRSAYPETFTDPSYRGQILVLTYPLIGNYGVNGEDVTLIDEVCWFFPELRFVTRHGCEPWTDLMVKLMLKYPNLYYSTSAFAPSWPALRV